VPLRASLGLAIVAIVAGACSDQSITPAAPPGVSYDGGTEDAPPAVADTGTPRPVGTIRVAQLNTHRYFDTVCDSGKCTSADFEGVQTQAEFDAATDKLAKGIALIDPDVISVEEVETQGCLDALNAKLATLGKMLTSERPAPRAASTSGSWRAARSARSRRTVTRCSPRPTARRPRSRASCSRCE
jgi:predicted extracellular nuclease